MKFPLSWLNDFVDIAGISADEFRREMTMSGTMIEGITPLGDEIENVVLGKILSVDPHPDADKLVVCQVDVGKEKLQIVTGAPNVQSGQFVPVALDGSTLPGGKKIKKGALRGVESCGMMCGIDELIPSEPPATGIHIIATDSSSGADSSAGTDLTLGTDIREVMGLNDTIVEVELTANRPDCQAIMELARETAATFNREFNEPETPEISGNLKDIKVTVENQDACPRYTARKVENIRIKPSPDWLARRLQNSGVRAINNIVDITNYVMLELGQPLHAFDEKLLGGNQINVRFAKDGEKIVTLDEIERTLTGKDLVIADDEKPVAIAGVMGGEGSGISQDTKAIIFESANFNGATIRRTSKRIGLRTEASARYEKGIDPNLAIIALNRACELVQMLDAGDVCDGMIDIHDTLKTSWKVPFSAAKINTFLGTDISEKEMIEILNKVGIVVENASARVPTRRADVTTIEDLSEEIARFYGYNNIETAPLSGAIVGGGLTMRQEIERKTVENLTAQGIFEIMTYSFISPRDYEKISAEMGDVVKISNPLGEEHSIMRTQSASSMLDALYNNVRLGNPRAWLFELATVYIPSMDSKPPCLPNEKQVLTIGMYGDDADFFCVKGIAENLLDSLGVKPYTWKVPAKIPAHFHPYQTAELVIRGKDAGLIGCVHPAVCSNYDIKTPAFIVELDFEMIAAAANLTKKFKTLPKFPAMVRDIALLVKQDILVGEIENVIRSVKTPILESIKLFDVYSGEQVAEGHKSVAYSLTFRAADRTLVDKEVNAVMGEIVAKLHDKLKAEIRN